MNASRWFQLLADYRADAEAWRELCESRYDHDVGCMALMLARRWSQALATEPPDFDEVLAVAREVQQSLGEHKHDVAFFGWCNDVVQMREALWAAWLEHEGR